MKIRLLLFYILCFIGLSITVNAESISGYEATVNTVKEKNVEFKDTVIDNENCKMVKITGESTYGYYTYTISGLDPNKIYSFTADVKTDNVTGRGAALGVERSADNFFYNYSFTRGTNGTSDWINKKLIIKATNDGKAIVMLGIGYARKNIGIDGTGTVYFKNLKLIDSSLDNEIKIGESTNKKIKLVLWKTDYDNYNFTSETFQKFLDKLATMNEYYIDLIGNSSHGVLEPAYSSQIVYNMTNTSSAGGMSGTPIEINNNYMSKYLKNATDDNYIAFIYLHETGHIYDHPLANSDKTYQTSNTRWTIDKEQTASFYPLYVLDQMGILTDDDSDYNKWLAKYKATYEDTVAKGTYSGDGYSYLLSQIKKGDKTDWDAFKQTFKWFNDLSTTDYNKYINQQDNKKGIWFLKKLDDYSESNVRNIFKDNEIETIMGKFNPLDSIHLEQGKENKTIELTNNYKLNIKLSSNTSHDVLVYESSDEDVAVVDDFGNVTLKDTAKDSVTITVKSFLNPNVKSSFTYKVTPTLTEEKSIEKNKNTLNNEIKEAKNINNDNYTSTTNPKTIDSIKIISLLLALSLFTINEMLLLKKCKII